MTSTKLPTFGEARESKGLTRTDVQRATVRAAGETGGNGTSYKTILQVEEFRVIPTDTTRERLAKAIGEHPDNIDWIGSDVVADAIAQAGEFERRIRRLLPDAKLVAALTRTIEHAEARAGD